MNEDELKLHRRLDSAVIRESVVKIIEATAQKIEQRWTVKLGIPLLVVGVALLLISIPYSILSIIAGVNRLTQSDLSGGVLAYSGVVGVVVGFVLTTIGAIRVFKR